MADRVFTIYKATNTLNDKVYIGVTNRWPNRKTEHLYQARTSEVKSYKSHFHRAIRKYGPDAFEWEVIYQSKDYDFLIKNMEPHFIAEYRSYDFGYNMTTGGEGSIGVKHSIETRKKHSKRMLGNKNLLGSKMGEATAEKLRQTNMGNKYRVGLLHSDETRHKMSMAHKGRPHTEEHKAAMREAWVRRKQAK